MAESEVTTPSPDPQPATESQLLLWAVVPNCYSGALHEKPIVKCTTLAEATQWALQHPQFDLVRLP